MCYMGQEFSTSGNLLLSRTISTNISLETNMHMLICTKKKNISVEESFYYNEREQNTPCPLI